MSDTFDELLSEIQEESDLDKVLKTFLDPANIAHLSELTDNQIFAFSGLSMIASRYKWRTLDAWLHHFQSLQVSKGRKGRSEFVRISQRTADPPREAERRGFGSWFRRE